MRIVWLCLILAACANLKQQELYQVRFEGMQHRPYCGGARPTPEVAAGFTEPLTGKHYFVFEGTIHSKKSKPLGELTLDSLGMDVLQLRPGNYYLLDADKTLTLEKFIGKTTLAFEKNFAVSDASCFEKWQQTPDVLFEVQGNKLVSFTLQANCWTGLNPCVKYVGPPAQ